MIFFSNKTDANYDKIFFEHEIKNIDGELISLEMYRDKVVLLVNTASYCVFTKQYADLQELYENYKEKNFIVLGVPSIHSIKKRVVRTR